MVVGKLSSFFGSRCRKCFTDTFFKIHYCGDNFSRFHFILEIVGLHVCMKRKQSGWPSGLRRQTQVISLLSYCWEVQGRSGPLMWAWVRIPLLTILSKIRNTFVLLHALHFRVWMSRETIAFVNHALSGYGRHALCHEPR